MQSSSLYENESQSSFAGKQPQNPRSSAVLEPPGQSASLSFKSTTVQGQLWPSECGRLLSAGCRVVACRAVLLAASSVVWLLVIATGPWVTQGCAIVTILIALFSFQ